MFENLSIENDNPLTDSSLDLSFASSEAEIDLTQNNFSNFNNSNNQNNLKMPSQFKTEYLSCVPQFDGNANDLNRYIQVCDSLILNFYDRENPQNFHNTYLLNSLISKLTGNAKLVVNIQNCSTWEELKQTLLNNFGDQRDESCLNRDLVMMRQQPQEKPQNFYDRVLNILNLLCSYIDAHEITNESKILKRNLYNNLALRTFLSGLKEPLATTIRCMKPNSLNEAMQFVTQENNVNYFQNFSYRSNQPQNNQNKNFVQPKHSNFNNQFNSNTTPNNFFRQQPNFPSQPINIQPRPNPKPQKFFTNSEVFKQPQPQKNVNVFKPNPNQTFPKPTPMSVSTRNTSHNYRQYQPPIKNIFQATGPRNFISEELFNTETNNSDQINQNQSIDYSEIPSTSHEYFEQPEMFEQDENYTEENYYEENFSTQPQTKDQT